MHADMHGISAFNIKPDDVRVGDVERRRPTLNELIFIYHHGCILQVVKRSLKAQKRSRHFS